MKLFFLYLKQRRAVYVLFAAFSLIFLACFLLSGLPGEAVIYPALLCVLLGIAVSLWDFRRVMARHEALVRIKGITDAIELSFPEASGIEEEDYREIIRLMAGEHSLFRWEKAREFADMTDYYTLWAHQIKTPIASMDLSLQAEDTPLARKLYGDLRRIEQYVEMALTFLRLNSESTDYLIREYELDPIIRQAVKKYSHEFIARKLRLEYKGTASRVLTDEKWLSFVIEQLLSNALKYTPSGSIEISVDARSRLSITDTGMGIAPEDLPRIFEKGYTGLNGRADKRASGIGLYLCKRICDSLGHGISVRSAPDAGTAVTLELFHKKLEIE